jgi:hypothetical protein
MRILSVKKILISGLAALSLGLAGCLTDSKDDDKAPTITTHPTDQDVAYGETVTFSVVATGKAPLTYTWVSADGDTLSDTNSATWTGVPPAEANGLVLKCIVSNSVGSVTSNTATLTITGLAACPTINKTVTLGAQGAAQGSALDLDTAGVWNSATANANQAKIDLVLLYFDGEFNLSGALAARDSGKKYVINLTDGYDSTQVKDIKFVLVAEKPANQQLAMEIYADAEEADELLRSIWIEAGDKLVVKTTEGKYVYVEVTTVTGTTSAGTAVLTLSLSTL